MTARELNAREREQRLQEREQLAIDFTLGPRSPLSGAQTPHFGSTDVTEQEDEVLIVRATPPPAEKEDPFVLPASTAPALLETNSRPKRARGPTLDYKAMHEGKQIVPKRDK